MYKINNSKEIEVFLVHPGGPFWKDKDLGAWSIPKGEVEESNNDVKEDFLLCAKREFEEELGVKLKRNDSEFVYIGDVKQKSGKIVHCWIFEDKGEWPGFFMKQHIIEIEYPYKLGKMIKIPEVDKAQFFKLDIAKEKINPAQKEFIEMLEEKLKR